MADSDALTFGDGNDVSIAWDGTDLDITVAADDSVINVGDGTDSADVKVFGNTASDFLLWDASASTLSTAGAAGVTLAGTGGLTITDVDVVLSATTGTKIGTATTQKLGFYNATPVDQPGAYTQTYSTADKTHAALTSATLTDNSAGSANTTIEALTDGTTWANDVASVRNNFADLAASNNAIIADLTDVKQLVNAVIDDLQELGLVG